MTNTAEVVESIRRATEKLQTLLEGVPDSDLPALAVELLQDAEANVWQSLDRIYPHHDEI